VTTPVANHANAQRRRAHRVRPLVAPMLCWSALAMSLVAFAACRGVGDEPSRGPILGGETHWLNKCQTDDECEAGLVCICSVCTLACETSDACDTGERGGAFCATTTSDDLSATCGPSSAPSLGLCMASCVDDRACSDLGTPFACIDGICVQALPSDSGQLAVWPNEIEFPPTAPGERASALVRIQNTGPDPVDITSFGTVGPSTFQLRSDVSHLPFTLTPGKQHVLEIVYRPDDGLSSSATIVIESDVEDAYKAFVHVRAAGFCGSITPDVTRVEIPSGGASSSSDASPHHEHAIALRNTGATDVTITRIDTNLGSGSAATLGSSLPLTMRSGAFTALHLSVTPPVARDASVTLHYRNGCDTDASTTIHIAEATSAPCARISPIDGLRFNASEPGSSHVLTVENCASGASGATLVIDDVAISLDDQADAPDATSFAVQIPETAVAIGPGDVSSIVVSYHGAAQGASGTLSFRTSDPNLPQARVPVSATPDGQCTSIGLRCSLEGSRELLQPGSLVAGVSEITCAATASPDGQRTWTWSVGERPVPHHGRITAEGAAATVSFGAFGAYTVRADHSEREAACPTGRHTVHYAPRERLAIEATWHAPNDLDPSRRTSTLGADVDLYVARESDAWHRIADAVSFRNRAPLWDGDVGPRMSAEAANGLGPEHVVYEDPADGDLRVGLHYYSDNGWGPAVATVRVFVDGALAAEIDHIPLDRRGDFVDVARVSWPSGEVVVLMDEVEGEIAEP